MYGKRNRGQAYTEYVVVMMAVVLVLLARDESGRTYLDLTIEAIKQHYQGYATSVALPPLPSNAHK
jgi:hypothetical protein